MSQAMSSPPSSSLADSDTRPASAGSSPTAFVVYSPTNLKDKLDVNSESKTAPRQKRRRTSPEDQKILEEEFARNPKPDKPSRLEIVKKVALGEKEIQIWFQNRRQASRRRQEPTGHSDDLTASQDSRSRANSGLIPSPSMQAPTSTPPAVEVPDIQNESASSAEAAEEKVAEEQVTQEKDVVESETERKEAAPAKLVLFKDELTGSAYIIPETPTSSQTLPSSQETSQDTTRSTILKPGYFANRRSASYILSSEDFFVPAPQHVRPPPVQARPPPVQVPRVLHRASSSNIVLSMTDDGKACVKDRNVPSPPRAPPVKIAGLRRSHSAAGLSDLFRASASESSPNKFPRLSQAGRSKHSQNWNFLCDRDTRAAELESATANAASEIKLIRQSSRSALRPNPRKANTPVRSPQDSSLQRKTPGLQRASTTHGRLQQGKKGGEVEVWEQANNDSDKENWEPEGGQPQMSRRRLHPSSARGGRQVLGENTQLLSQSASLGAMMNREKKAKSEVDPEVQAFMGSARGATGGKVVGDELDCVASLLSLSKGNWK
ncbi:hypothetical protein EG328_009819 [Venturia inaequalis]|uniref:Homeobox domain-containing protein n=1 Tax=Venturia inaequalis TaxID=5025 RepID=A0A8H3UQS1_VENIN|nr:hypothetical protein EG328_009819 [Venturia inaequalis]KAE9974600.1 hypothetical protein EG327_008723 [Venturia inaequalis]RDI83349.1 hypothetical protein Vi05172_g6654 [Venturia inaequalis]